jgi:hypothetical protein
MSMPQLPLAYLGPETILPMASVLTAAVGVLLICWRFVLRIVTAPFHTFFGKKDTAPTQTAPVETGAKVEP